MAQPAPPAWRLGHLLEGLTLQASGKAGDPVIHDITDDSREVRPGSLFLARPGSGGDGRQYLDDAISRGAAAVLLIGEDKPPANATIPLLRLADAPARPQVVAGQLAERFFGSPGRDLRLIGITGTNGKTTTAFLVHHLLNQAGLKTGMIGTVIVDDGGPDGPEPALLTTPGAIGFSRLLAHMRHHGCKAVVAEISSHALDQGRIDALDLDVAVFTNLTGDHLDYHGSMENYAAAKRRLFELLPREGTAIINAQDPAAAFMAEAVTGPLRWTMLQAEHAVPRQGAHCHGRIVELGPGFSRAQLIGPWGTLAVHVPLVGRHNLSNLLQALAAADAILPDATRWPEALTSLPPVPGRLEPVGPNWPQPVDPSTCAHLPTVLVDYAHTDDALLNVLQALREVTCQRLHVIFGCGGDRDRTKRPRMAEVACALADAVVITSDNPRSEDPQAIVQEVAAGVPADRRACVHVEVDRAVAIAQTIARADVGDTVLIAGKGHEDYQILADGRIHFDDREQAALAMRKRRRSDC